MPIIQAIQKGFFAFRDLDSDPFALKRPTPDTPRVADLFEGFPLISREKLGAKLILGAAQVQNFMIPIGYIALKFLAVWQSLQS